MKQRKTISLEDLKSDINQALAAEYTTKTERETLSGMLEKWLMNRGSYQGFGFLEINRVPKGHKPGINKSFGESAAEKTTDELFKDTDSSRRYYY